MVDGRTVMGSREAPPLLVPKSHRSPPASPDTARQRATVNGARACRAVESFDEEDEEVVDATALGAATASMTTLARSPRSADTGKVAFFLSPARSNGRTWSVTNPVLPDAEATDSDEMI